MPRRMPWACLQLLGTPAAPNPCLPTTCCLTRHSTSPLAPTCRSNRVKAVRSVVEAGVAVMGHVGLTPQAISVLGGFRPAAQSGAAEMHADRVGLLAPPL